MAELILQYPELGHEWEDTLEYSFNGNGFELCAMAGGGPLFSVLCKKCGYKTEARLAYSFNRRIKVKVEWYDKDNIPTCDEVVMDRALG